MHCAFGSSSSKSRPLNVRFVTLIAWNYLCKFARQTLTKSLGVQNFCQPAFVIKEKKNRMGTMATFIKSARADIYARSFFFKRCFLCRLCMLLYQSYTTHTHWHTDTHKHTQPTVTADNTHGEGPSTRQKCFILRVSACTHLARIAACTRTMQAFLNLK